MKQVLLALLLCMLPTAMVAADSHLIAVASNVGFFDEPELRFAEQDARAMRDVLKQFGGHERLHEHMLLGADATRLEHTLKHLHLTPNDALYVYYSGHADKDGLHLGTTVLPFDTLKALVESLPARVKLLVLDACGSGQITRIKGGRPAPPFSIAIDDRLNIAGTAIVTSSADSEDSQESDELGGSFFTYHFLQGLRGAADRDHDRLVTLNEAFGYASRQTLRSTALTHQLQHPMFRGKLHGQGTELVLSRLEAARASAVISLAGPASYLMFDERDELFAEVTVEDAHARYLLPAGKWLVQKRSSGGAEEQRIELSAGDEKVLSDRDATPVPLTRLEAKGRADNGKNQRIQMLGGASGPVASGHSPLPTLWLGYRHGLRPIDLVGEVHIARDSNADELIGVRIHGDYGLDIGRVRFAAGLAAELNLQRQRYPQRATQLYGGVGVLGSMDLKLSGALAVRVEGGPVLHIVKLKEHDRSGVTTRLNWWLAAGPSWGF